MKCKKCGSRIFLIDENNSCDDCKHNPAWNEEENNYTYDQETIDRLGLTRNYVEEERECGFGGASGDGCYMITCKFCEQKFNIPLVDY